MAAALSGDRHADTSDGRGDPGHTTIGFTFGFCAFESLRTWVKQADLDESLEPW